MTDLRFIDAFLKARDGDLRLLADVIEAGYNLDETTRKFLAQYLRDEVTFQRGNRRTFVAQMEDARVLRLVTLLSEYEEDMKRAADKLGVKYKPKGGLRAYLDLHPDCNENTVKTQLSRARRDRRGRENRSASRVSK